MNRPPPPRDPDPDPAPGPAPASAGAVPANPLAAKFLVGTSGFAYLDWIGPFYPRGLRPAALFAHYRRLFPTLELNYTFYRMPTVRSMAHFAGASPVDFRFWVKAHEGITHHHRPALVPEFCRALGPLRDCGKLAGVLLQFPQAFHRTAANRRYLGWCTEAFAGIPLAVEFRHRSWRHPHVVESLRRRQVTLAVPDAPAIAALYHAPPLATTRTAYLRLHSRHAGRWYAGAIERYDYDYTPAELATLADDWMALAGEVDEVYVFFNNCHAGQAARNAEAFRRLLDRHPGLGR